MRSAIAVPLLAALAGAQDVVDFNLIFSEAPSYSSVQPVTTHTPNAKVVAASIESRLSAVHTPVPTSPHATTKAKTTTHHKTKTTTKKAKTTKKKTTKTAVKHPKSPVHKHHKSAKHGKRQATATTTSQAACVSQAIYYSYVPTPNNATGFLTDTTLQSIAANALAPAGYTQGFSLQYGSLFANNYLGYYQLASYNVSACTALCASYSGCQAVNMYFERDPVVNPGPTCANPTSAVSVRCALWGSSISAAQALDIGEWRTNFMVVIQGSNGYTANTPPPAQVNFTGPVALAGAISTSSGSTYLGSSFQSGAYDVSFCAQACQTTTSQNRQAAGAAGNSTFTPCQLFNTFKVNYNGSYVGTYCKLYSSPNETVNGVQYTATASNGVTYNLDNSYGFTLNPQDSGIVPAAQISRTSTVASSTQSATATSQTPAPATLTAACSQINGTGTFVDSNNVNYVVDCSHDLLGVGDLSSRTVSSFAACFAACDGVSGCQAIAFVAQGGGSGVCYFKSLKGVTAYPNYNTAVDLAWQSGAYTGTAKTTSAAATATTR